MATHFFEIPKGISGGERERERVREGAAEQRKGTTTWRIVACRELLRMATVRQFGREGWGCNTGLSSSSGLSLKCMATAHNTSFTAQYTHIKYKYTLTHTQHK